MSSHLIIGRPILTEGTPQHGLTTVGQAWLRYGVFRIAKFRPHPPERSGPTGSEPPVPMIDRFDDGVPLLIVEGFNDEGSSPRAPSPSRYIADENEMNALGVRSPDQISRLVPAMFANSFRTKYRLSGRINSHSTLGSSLSRRFTRIRTPPGSLALDTPIGTPHRYPVPINKSHRAPGVSLNRS